MPTPKPVKPKVHSHSSENDVSKLFPPSNPRQAKSQTTQPLDDYTNFYIDAAPPSGPPHKLTIGPSISLQTGASMRIRSPNRSSMSQANSPDYIPLSSAFHSPNQHSRILEVNAESPISGGRSLLSRSPVTHQRALSSADIEANLFSGLNFPIQPFTTPESSPPPYMPIGNNELLNGLYSDNDDNTPLLDDTNVSADSKGISVQNGAVNVRIHGDADLNGRLLLRPRSNSQDSESDGTSSIEGDFQDHVDPALSAYLYAILSSITLKSSFHFSWKFLLSLIAGGASAINATMNPSGSQPRDISQKWWDSLTTWIAFVSILNGMSSLLVNFVFAYQSIPAAGEKLRKNLLTWPQSPRQIAENIGTVTLGSAAAIASAGIAFNAFEWTELFLAETVTIASLFINFTTRYVAVRTLVNRARSFTDDELLLKNSFNDDLAHIETESLEEINRLLQQAFIDNDKVFDDAMIGKFLTKLQTLPDADFIAPVSRSAQLQHRAVVTLELLFAGAIGIAALPTFTQKGYDGLNKLAEILGSHALSDISKTLELTLGFAPGMATAMLYAVSAYDLPRMLYNILKGIKDNPSVYDMTVFSIFFGANCLASGSMQNVTEGVLKNPKRIFEFLSLGSVAGDMLILLNRLGGGVTNAKSSFQKLFSTPNMRHPHIKDVRNWLHEIHIDNRLSENTLTCLKSYSVFRKHERHPNGYVPLFNDHSHANGNGHTNGQVNGNGDRYANGHTNGYYRL